MKARKRYSKPHKASAYTSPKGRLGPDLESPHAEETLEQLKEQLTERQRKFLEFKMQFPWPSSAKAARLAVYSEWVAQKADRIIIRGSPKVNRIWEEWNR